MKKPTLILAAGMYRSGSTFQYNCLRLILEHRHGPENVYGCFVWNYQPEKHRHKPYHLVKLHLYDPELAKKASLIFTAIRDKPGIVASMERNRENHIKHGRAHLLGNAQEPRFVDIHLDHFEKWRSKCDFIQPFEEIKNVDYLIRAHFVTVAGVLPSVYDVRTIKKNLNAITLPKTGYDDTTLLYCSHITKG